MKTYLLAGISFAIGVGFAWAAFFSFWKMREELSEKFPEKTDWLFSLGWGAMRFQQTYNMHVNAFPHSVTREKHKKHVMGFAIATAISWVSFLSTGFAA